MNDVVTHVEHDVYAENTQVTPVVGVEYIERQLEELICRPRRTVLTSGKRIGVLKITTSRRNIRVQEL